MTKEVKITLKDVWTAVQSLAQTTQSLVETVGFIKDNAVSQEEFGGLKEEFGGLKEEVRIIRSTMITKSYLDRKISNIRDEMHGVDSKPKKIAEILKKKKLLNKSEMNKLCYLKPFPWVNES